jgi:hypothetical protein
MSPMIDADLPRSASLRKTSNTKQDSGLLKVDEKIKMRTIIKQRLCQAPYSAAFLF